MRRRAVPSGAVKVRIGYGLGVRSRTNDQERFGGPAGGSYEVRVQLDVAADARPLSCSATTEDRPPTYALLSVNGG